MATLNERINDMLSRLEAAASSLDDSSRDPSRPAPKSTRYSYQPPASRQTEEAAGPGSFARSIDEAKEKRSQDKAGRSGSAVRTTGIVPHIAAQSMVQGVIFAEILGRPVSRRRGRGRRGF